MYAGVGGYNTLKGSGLSGYVQHSRAVARTQLFDAVEGSHMIDRRTPLEKLRSQKENDAMAARLEEHMRWRALEVQVLEFEESLRAKDGFDDQAIEAQCAEYKATLTAQLEDTLRKERAKKQQQVAATTTIQRAKGQKTANDFAIAFGVGNNKKPTQ